MHVLATAVSCPTVIIGWIQHCIVRDRNPTNLGADKEGYIK